MSVAKTVAALRSPAMNPILALASCALLAACASQPKEPDQAMPASQLDLGAFSVSLVVKDLAASREFYGKLGFEPAGGDPAQNWQVLRNGDCVIGLFQGFIPKNTLTFNPGWTQQKLPRTQFTDVRELQAKLEAAGMSFDVKADPATDGTAYFMLTDPDGNPILFDQHVPKPK